MHNWNCAGRYVWNLWRYWKHPLRNPMCIVLFSLLVWFFIVRTHTHQQCDNLLELIISLLTSTTRATICVWKMDQLFSICAIPFLPVFLLPCCVCVNGCGWSHSWQTKDVLAKTHNVYILYAFLAVFHKHKYNAVLRTVPWFSPLWYSWKWLSLLHFTVEMTIGGSI